jgi:undecaprenyl-diphosphatase
MLNSILLGIIQGLTEFLPISSSGHLVIFSNILKQLPDLESQIFFDVMLHFGTLLAVVIVFRRNLLDIFMLRDVALVRNILIAMIPTGIIALAFKETFEALFASARFASLMLLVTGGILLATRFKRENFRAVSWKIALLVGIMQGLAIIPGISRSGATIAAALLLGVKRETAGTFSFLLSVPAVLCAVLLKGRDMVAAGNVGTLAWGPVIAGTLVSLAVGVLALKILLVFVKQGRLYQFSVYCFLVGVLGIFVF